MSDMFESELHEETENKLRRLGQEINTLSTQNLKLLEIYYHLQLMLGEVSGEGEVQMHTESKWFIKLREITDEFDPGMEIFKKIESIKGFIG